MAGVSTAVTDALKRGIFGLVRASRPTLDYLAYYRAEVIVQSGDRRTVDVKPDDDRLPPMSKVKLKLGIPGATVEIGPGTGVMIGWENGDPQRPYVQSFDKGAPTPTLSLVAGKIELAQEGLAFPMDGLVHGTGTDPFTGLPYWMLGNASTVVGGKK